MLTKYFLHIAGEDYELRDDDLRNWDEIRCSYKRTDYEGVVRSFSSQFEFVNQAKNLLLALYLKDRFNAVAAISVWTMNDRWTYDKKFECPLDFSTIAWDSFSLKINSVDNSLAAMIKANKGTKYEFAIGKDIKSKDKMLFDRIPMIENASYEFTQGESLDDGSIKVTFIKDNLPWVGSITSEVSVKSSVLFKDDQDPDDGGFCLKALKEVSINLDWELLWKNLSTESDEAKTGSVDIYVQVRRNGAFLPVGGDTGALLVTLIRNVYHDCGTYASEEDFPDADTVDEDVKADDGTGGYGTFAFVRLEDDTIFQRHYNGSGWDWQNTGKTDLEAFLSIGWGGSLELKLQAGDCVVITSLTQSEDGITVTFTKSLFSFSWIAKGDPVEIDVFRPKEIARKLLCKMAGDEVNYRVNLSGYDERLESTYIMAAESARGLQDAKFYSSFSEFCDWMSAVFGYVYSIGEIECSPFHFIQESAELIGTAYPIEDSPYPPESPEEEEGEENGENEEEAPIIEVIPDYIVYIPHYSKFIFKHPEDGKFYGEWPGSDAYNDPETGHPRTDTLFRIRSLSNTLFYFKEYEGADLNPIAYEFEEEEMEKDIQNVSFMHRSEIFSEDADIREIKYCRELQYSVDTSVIYSAVTIGYDKKDYDSINGRDEFNFNNTYSTGCIVSDKTLSILSKYRADCYGIEFATQKRGADTTDSDSDKDVFFVLLTRSTEGLVPDRSLEIENSISDSVFNGAFSPMACVRANAGLIGLQADEMELTFASSTGNSTIIIDGEPMSADITVDTPFATCGSIEFTTDETDDIKNVGDLIEVTDDGVLYRGYLKDVDIKYAKAEAVKYKLIVKDIEA